MPALSLRLHAEGQVAQAQGRHGPHGGAGHLHPSRGERAAGVLEHRRSHRGRCPCHRERPGNPDLRVSQARRGRRGNDPLPLRPPDVARGCEAPSLLIVVAKHRHPSDIDVAVVGAGPVGATAAALLARPGVRIEVFEARPAPSADARTLALSHASRELIEPIGAWPEESTAIRSIHISQKGGPGRTLLESDEQGLPALGYTLGYAALESTLRGRLAALGIAVHAGEACEAIEL